MDDGDDAPSTSGRTAAAAAASKAGQNAELYNALGQHNPKKAKADLKKAKRAKADSAAAAAADGDDSDFDFDEANDADGLKGSEVGVSRTAAAFIFSYVIASLRTRGAYIQEGESYIIYSPWYSPWYEHQSWQFPGLRECCAPVRSSCTTSLFNLEHSRVSLVT
jgi:hypothetical protein